MLKKLAVNLAMVFAVGALAFGANEAYAASGAVNTQVCASNYNWCAPSQGTGDNWCTFCCQINGHENGGFCYSYEEMSDQGCLCY
jgi:hypothetical protein